MNETVPHAKIEIFVKLLSHGQKDLSYPSGSYGKSQNQFNYKINVEH